MPYCPAAHHEQHYNSLGQNHKILPTARSPGHVRAVHHPNALLRCLILQLSTERLNEP